MKTKKVTLQQNTFDISMLDTALGHAMKIGNTPHSIIIHPDDYQSMMSAASYARRVTELRNDNLRSSVFKSRLRNENPLMGDYSIDQKWEEWCIEKANEDTKRIVF